jgi:hypothetical protein
MSVRRVFTTAGRFKSIEFLTYLARVPHGMRDGFVWV